MIYLSSKDSLVLTAPADSDMSFYTTHIQTRGQALSVEGRESGIVPPSGVATIASQSERQKVVEFIVVRNLHGTDSVDITISVVTATETIPLFVATLLAGDSFNYSDKKIYIINSEGRTKAEVGPEGPTGPPPTPGPGFRLVGDELRYDIISLERA